MAGKKKRRIAVLDFETDPFLWDRIPVPFAWGFYDGERYIEHWQERAWESPEECAKILGDFLHDQTEPYLVYAHNGGKFDFLFMLDRFEGKLKIVNGRVLQGEINNCVLRDSYAILPIPLAQAGDKLEIDYMLMERDCREDHKPEIMRYLRKDCIALYDLVTAFINEFGEILTIGSAAMKQLKKFHDFSTANEHFDASFRKFYFGGRCQCFEVGVIDTPVVGVDLNSSYPNTMKRMMHPVSTDYSITPRIGKNTCFVTWEGENLGAVPIRIKEGLDFTQAYGTFHTSIHEFNAGLDTGAIVPKKIVEAYHFTKLMTFEDFIDHFYFSRLAAKKAGNKFLDIFYKLILNSAYGKFAQSPDNFEDYIICHYDEVPPAPFERRETHGKYVIWAKPSNMKTYFNVATAASITGGSRATLLRGLALATRPLYCDTDSIYCESFAGITDEKELGAWKHEFTGNRIAIAGKKLYAVMGNLADNPDMLEKARKVGKPIDLLEEICLKKASKGVTLNHLAIAMIARGDTCETRRDAPAFKLDGKHQFIARNIRRTG